MGATMTEAEARALKPGDLVEVRRGKGLEIVRVRRIEDHECWVRIEFDRFRLNSLGRPVKGGWRFAEELFPVMQLDFTTANIFADWLDERGEHRAAALLREAFPRVDANG